MHAYAAYTSNEAVCTKARELIIPSWERAATVQFIRVASKQVITQLRRAV